MKHLAALILFVVFAAPAQAQCTAPGCEEATAVVSAARATARAVLTREAPTPAPTWTPTILPTATAMPEPTQTATREPSATPQPIAATPTIAVIVVTIEIHDMRSATMPTPEAPSQPAARSELSPLAIVTLLAASAVILIGSLLAIWHFFFKPKERTEPND